MKEKILKILFPILLTLSYTVLMYLWIRYEWENGLLISVQGAAPIDIGAKFLYDCISSLLIVIVILFIAMLHKRPVNDMGINTNSPKLVAILFLAYVAMFLVNGDFSAKGFYAAFFYLVIVAFSEEFVFRGYLFSAIDKEFGFRIAVVISGILFGAVHAFIPAIVNDYNMFEFIIEIFSHLLGQGVLGTAFLSMLFKKSKTLFVPVLIHAALDYCSVLF